jgi:hypothetical protein
MQCQSGRRHCKHTIFLKILLVRVATSDVVFESFRLLGLLLNSYNPAVALFGVGGLELVGMGANLEREDIASLLGHVGDLVLRRVSEESSRGLRWDLPGG